MIDWKRAALGMTLACTLGASARAQPVDSAATPEKLALAQRVVTEGRIDQGTRLAMEAILRPFIQQINAGSAPAELKRYAIDLVKEEVSKMEGQVLPKFAGIYAGAFTEQQLRDLLVFYESPTGQVLLDKQAELVRAGQALVAPLILPLQKDMINKLFNHICETQHCTAAQRTKLDEAKSQLLAKFAAAQTAPAN